MTAKRRVLQISNTNFPYGANVSRKASHSRHRAKGVRAFIREMFGPVRLKRRGRRRTVRRR